MLNFIKKFCDEYMDVFRWAPALTFMVTLYLVIQIIVFVLKTILIINGDI